MTTICASHFPFKIFISNDSVLPVHWSICAALDAREILLTLRDYWLMINAGPIHLYRYRHWSYLLRWGNRTFWRYIGTTKNRSHGIESVTEIADLMAGWRQMTAMLRNRTPRSENGGMHVMERIFSVVAQYFWLMQLCRFLLDQYNLWARRNWLAERK